MAQQRSPPEPGRPVRVLKKATNPLQADVLLVGEGPGARVRKDTSGRPWWARATVARWPARKEARALRALEGTGVAPRLLAFDGADALEMEAVQGARLPKKRDPLQPGPDVFERLGRLLAAMRAAGVAHGDLRRANILWNPADGSVRFIDFGSAVTLGERPWPWRRALFGAVASIDRATLAKIERSYLDGGADGAEAHYPWFLKLGRALRQRLYRPLKRAFRGSRRSG
jgi:hypothetical protein